MSLFFSSWCWIWLLQVRSISDLCLGLPIPIHRQPIKFGINLMPLTIHPWPTTLTTLYKEKIWNSIHLDRCKSNRACVNREKGFDGPFGSMPRLAPCATLHGFLHVRCLYLNIGQYNYGRDNKYLGPWAWKQWIQIQSQTIQIQ